MSRSCGRLNLGNRISQRLLALSMKPCRLLGFGGRASLQSCQRNELLLWSCRFGVVWIAEFLRFRYRHRWIALAPVAKSACFVLLQLAQSAATGSQKSYLRIEQPTSLTQVKFDSSAAHLFAIAAERSISSGRSIRIDSYALCCWLADIADFH